MEKPHNLQQYKNAKVHVEHLEAIYKILDLAIKGLSYYEVYTPASMTISYLQMQRDVTAAHLKLQKKILKNKGKV